METEIEEEAEMDDILAISVNLRRSDESDVKGRNIEMEFEEEVEDVAYPQMTGHRDPKADIDPLLITPSSGEPRTTAPNHKQRSPRPFTVGKRSIEAQKGMDAARAWKREKERKAKEEAIMAERRSDNQTLNAWSQTVRQKDEEQKR